MPRNEVVDDIISFSSWMRSVPSEWSLCVMARSAIRVLPWALPDGNKKSDEAALASLQIFRSAVSIWAVVGRVYQADMSVYDAAANGYRALQRMSASRTQLSACSSIVNAAYSVYRINDRSDAGKSSTINAFSDAVSGADAAFRDFALGLCWSSVQRDISVLKSAHFNGRSNPSSILYRQPLWISDDPRFSSAIESTFLRWYDFEKSNLCLENDFWPWVIWYNEVILRGLVNPSGEISENLATSLYRELSAQANSWWSRGPKIVNRDIRSFIERGNVRIDSAIQMAISQLPEQRRASYLFKAKDGRVFAEKQTNDELDTEFVSELIESTKVKIAEFNQMAVRTDSLFSIKATVKSVSFELDRQIPDLRLVGLLASHRTIEAFCQSSIADASSISSDALKCAVDLNMSLKDVLICFPRIREMERARLAYELPDEATASRVKDALDSISSATLGNDFVDDSVLEAQSEMRRMAESSRGLTTFASNVSDYALVMQNYASAVIREIGDTLLNIWKSSKVEIIKGVSSGVKKMAKPVTIIAISAAIGSILGPLAGAAALLAGFGSTSAAARLIKSIADRMVSGDGSDRGEKSSDSEKP